MLFILQRHRSATSSPGLSSTIVSTSMSLSKYGRCRPLRAMVYLYIEPQMPPGNMPSREAYSKLPTEHLSTTTTAQWPWIAHHQAICGGDRMFLHRQAARVESGTPSPTPVPGNTKYIAPSGTAVHIHNGAASCSILSAVQSSTRPARKMPSEPLSSIKHRFPRPAPHHHRHQRIQVVPYTR